MIYFIQAENGGPIKIGYANDIPRRIFTLQEGNPYRLMLLGSCEGTRSVEYRLHVKFDAHRVRNEWFEDCDDIQKFIADLPNFDYRTLFMTRRKRSAPSKSYDYTEFNNRMRNTIAVNEWSEEEAKAYVYECLKKELMEFGHKEKTSHKIAARYWPGKKSLLYDYGVNAKLALQETATDPPEARSQGDFPC